MVYYSYVNTVVLEIFVGMLIQHGRFQILVHGILRTVAKSTQTLKIHFGTEIPGATVIPDSLCSLQASRTLFQEIIPFVWENWDNICTKRSRSGNWKNNLASKMVSTWFDLI